MKTSRLGCFFAFAGIGPAVGGVLVSIFMIVVEAYQGNLSFSSIPFVLLGSLYFSYIFGLLPAVFTGALLSWIGVGLSRRHWLLTATASGACAGLLFAMLLGGKEAVELIVLLVPISAVSAFVCALKFQPAKRSNQEQDASGAMPHALSER